MPKKIFKEVIGQDYSNPNHFFFRDDKIEEWIISNIPDKYRGKEVKIEVEFKIVEDKKEETY